MRSSLHSTALLVLLVGGCSETRDPGAITELVLVSDVPTDDSAVYLTGELRETALTIDVWVRGMDDVFGVAAHVVHDGILTQVDEDTPFGGVDEARYLAIETEGDIASAARDCRRAWVLSL